MKNLKKVLALALVFAMTLTLFAGAAFTDQDSIGSNYVDDVNMLVELGVLKGYEDNSFRPQNNVTRAEFAKMAYTLKYGADDQGLLFSGSKSEFADVEGVSSIAWAKGYINYCANQKIIAGVGNGKFNPNGNVTVAEAAKMLLVILGCDPQTEGFVGMNWQGNVVAKAIALKIFDGYAGDPTQPATRELVAKLMRNTVFSPIYIYSPITGAGSQMQILEPGEYNPTLGEETMGLKHVTGIVVANEFNSISTDGEGIPFEYVDSDNDGNWDNVVYDDNGAVLSAAEVIDEIAPTGKEQTRIKYQDENEKTGLIEWFDLYLPDESLSDDMLGNLVDVYYTHETESEKSKINVLGNVLVNSKTVVYEVAASDIDMMPNGESRKAGQMRPEIVFTAGEDEYTISAPAGTARVNIKANDYNGQAFLDNNMFYSFNAAPNGDLEAASSLVRKPGAVIANMGEEVPTSYRLVSIDGGKNISYIMTNPNYTAGTITSYNEAKGTIASSTVLGSNNDMDDIVVYDGLKKGDYVVATVKSGKIVLEPTTTISGAVTGYSKNTAVINDTTYVGSQEFLNDVGFASLADFYSNAAGRGAARGATYIVYGNMILDIDEDAVVDVDLGNYAVVLKSAVDEATGDVTVKLGTSDGKDATYTVSYFVDKAGKSYDPDEDDSFSGEFANNGKVGYIVSYDLRDGKAEITEEEIFQTTAHQVKDEGIVYDGKQLWATDTSLMFLLYTSSATSRNVRFKTYKLSDMADRTSAEIPVYTEGDNYKDLNGAAVLKPSTSSKEVLMGVMTYGIGTPSMLSDGEAVGYVVDSVVEYDSATRKDYLQLSLISMDEKALISGKYMDAKKADLVGSAGTYQEGSAKYAIGSIAQYAHDGSNFTALDVNKLGSIEHQEKLYDPANTGDEAIGFFKVTIADANSSRISFYSFGETATADQDGKIDDSALTTVSVDEHEFDVVAIADDEPAGEDIEEISKYDTVDADDYNAIIEIDSTGKIVKVFSLHGLIG